MVNIALEKSRMHKEWQQMAYLQAYSKGNKAFSRLHCQSFEHLINFCSSKLKKKKQ